MLDDLSAALWETGVTTVFVTHDRDEAMRLGGRMAVLMNGEIRQVGPTADVFASPVDREVAAFVGVETIVTGRVRSLEHGLAVVDVAGRRVEVASTIEAGGEVLVCLRPEDVVLTPTDGPPGPSSARNHLPAVVQRTVNVGFQVRVELDAGFPLVVLITKQSLEELSLGPGSRVAASFKATAAHLIPRRVR
jgi:molybdopterin-binding protein